MSDLLVKIIADWLVIAVALVGGIGFLLLVKKDWREAIGRALLTGLTALWLAKIASLFYQGERPFVLLGEDPKAEFLNNPGFPSDHTLLVFAVTFIVWGTTKNVPLTLALLVMSILVAVGRVLALVHSPIDVLGGAACALLAATIIYGKKLYSFK
jgi:membrane-associated phospholipid phosphatase